MALKVPLWTHMNSASCHACNAEVIALPSSSPNDILEVVDGIHYKARSDIIE